MPHAAPIGLDARARSIKGCAFNPFTGEISRKSSPYDPVNLNLNPPQIR